MMNHLSEKGILRFRVFFIYLINTLRQFFRWWYPDAFSFTHIHTLYTTIQEIWLSEWWNIFVHRPVQNRNYVATWTSDRYIYISLVEIQKPSCVCIYIYIMYNDEKNFADNYLRCLPVVLGTAFVRRTLQETSVHNELKLQIKVCCLSTTFTRQRRPHLNSLPLFLPWLIWVVALNNSIAKKLLKRMKKVHNLWTNSQTGSRWAS